MAINFLRIPGVAALLPMLCLGILPGVSYAQLPIIDSLSAPNEANGNCVCACWQQPAEPPTAVSSTVFDEPESHGIFRFFRTGEWYVSWGGSRDYWAPSNIHVSQPAIGNSFTIQNVRAVDDPTWSSVFGGQYNIRFGRFIDEARTWAVEFNFDHTKYTSVVGQNARIVGTVGGKPTDATFRLDDSIFSYKLHNGANHTMINLVKRIPLIGEVNENFSVAGIAKFGVGVMLPHAENTVFGQPNNVGDKTFNNLIGFNRGWWQLDGWTTGIELGFRIVLVQPFYIEVTDKIAYAHIADVPVFQGTARQSLWMNEVIVSVGMTFGARR